jgi:hypothetical protein
MSVPGSEEEETLVLDEEEEDEEDAVEEADEDEEEGREEEDAEEDVDVDADESVEDAIEMSLVEEEELAPPQEAKASERNVKARRAFCFFITNLPSPFFDREGQVPRRKSPVKDRHGFCRLMNFDESILR